MTVQVPVLIIGFNRPEKVRSVFESLSKEHTSHVYLAIDGPRDDNETDFVSCRESAEIAKRFESDFSITCLQHSKNLGTGRAVPAAISWFFSHEKEGIILEDDCLPRPDFFQFSAEMLPTYRDEPTVMMISGNNHNFQTQRPADSYQFSRHGHIWGWATWRRAWDLYDHSMAAWPSLRRSTWLKDVCGGHRDAERYWRWIFDETRKDKFDAWDYRWTFAMWKEGGVSIVPARNLVENTGFDDRSTHTVTAPDWYKRISRGALQFPLRHPASVEADDNADRWTDIHIFSTNLRGLARAKQAVMVWLSRFNLDHAVVRTMNRFRS